MDGLLNQPKSFELAAPSPFESTQTIPVRVNTSVVATHAKRGSTTAIFELYYNVMGQVPPVNCGGYHEKDSNIADIGKGIMNAHVIFQGIKRGFIAENLEKGVYIYITEPSFRYIYKPGMVCVMKRVNAPPKALFAIYVRFYEEQGIGEIIYWEWVPRCEENLRMPVDHQARYDQMRWHK